jgi:cysteinyl-tRNA synthetase
MLRIYNTETRKKQPFRPLKGRRVRLYVCGVTVYDRTHLGHARSAIVFDTVRRYLECKGYRVRYVRNFTDVDDKIIHRAQKENVGWREIAERYIAAYREDMARLGVRPADIEPKATEHIPDMIKLIRRLVKKKAAYTVDGDVYFEVSRFRSYGRLSHRSLDEMMAGARVEVDPRKRNPLDFALWKASKPGEPSWESPWGIGRPGWHIECSAMATAHLGPTLDLHGGGMDLIFPHHENEIAQSEAGRSGRAARPFVRCWIHNGFVTIAREKMSKSLGNFFTVQEIFEKSPWPEAVTAETIRYLLLSTHYRGPLDWSDAALNTAKAGLDHFYNLLLRLAEAHADHSRSDKAVATLLKRFETSFVRAMDDDFNTVAVIAELQKLRAGLNPLVERGLSKTGTERVRMVLGETGGVLGLFQCDPLKWATGTGAPSSAMTDAEIEALVAEREQARRGKDWARSDAIRKRLAEAGVILEDRPDGTTRVKR